MSNALEKPEQSNDDAVAKVANLIAKTQVGMLATMQSDSGMVSRPMAVLKVAFDGTLWFVAQEGTRKVEQLRGDDRVNVSFSSDSTWVSVNGTASVVRDAAKARELWGPGVDAWLPQGPEASDIVLIRVEAEGAEYWDTPGAIVASALSFIKAKTTGEPYKVENDTAEL